MYIYKITNTINGKWYIGKHNGSDPHYMGSGKLLKSAYKKYGLENFRKDIIESCSSIEELNRREVEIITELNAVLDPNSYNLASGGEGGDLSKFHDYKKQGYKSDYFAGATKWFQSLTDDEKNAVHAKQGLKRTKGWYISRVDDPTEVYIQNIAKWCDDNNIDKSMPTALNSPNGRLFQKQTKGWRIRRSDMPKLPPYVNNRGKSRPNISCKGKGWKLVNGRRVWYDK
mgnify:CR=1 FL=1